MNSEEQWEIVGYCEGCGAMVFEMDDEKWAPNCICYDPTTDKVCTIVRPLDEEGETWAALCANFGDELATPLSSLRRRLSVSEPGGGTDQSRKHVLAAFCQT